MPLSCFSKPKQSDDNKYIKKISAVATVDADTSDEEEPLSEADFEERIKNLPMEELWEELSIRGQPDLIAMFRQLLIEEQISASLKAERKRLDEQLKVDEQVKNVLEQSAAIAREIAVWRGAALRLAPKTITRNGESYMKSKSVDEKKDKTPCPSSASEEEEEEETDEEVPTDDFDEKIKDLTLEQLWDELLLRGQPDLIEMFRQLLVEEKIAACLKAERKRLENQMKVDEQVRTVLEQSAAIARDICVWRRAAIKLAPKTITRNAEM